MQIDYKTAKNTKKNLLRALRHKLLSIIVVPYDGRAQSVQWNLSVSRFVIILVLLCASIVLLAKATEKIIATNYKIMQLERQNAQKKNFILAYEENLRKFLIEYAPKKDYINSQRVYLPNQAAGMPINIGGNEIKWDNDNTAVLENFYEATRSEVRENTGGSKELLSALDALQPVFVNSAANTQKLTHMFRQNKKSIAALPLSWPIAGGFGEISHLSSSDKLLEIETIPGSLVYPTGNGKVLSIQRYPGNTKITVLHVYGISSTYEGLVDSKISAGDEITRATVLGSTTQRLKYSIAINGKPLSVKSFAFLRY